MNTVTAEIRLEIEYPQTTERIISPYYSFRIGSAGHAESVDVSLDQGPWTACRKVHGFWWYDWSGYKSGEHEIIARAPGPDGRWLLSAPRAFTVAPNF